MNPHRGRGRLRFHGVTPDQMETILAALERARSELATRHDTVALEAICMDYIGGPLKSGTNKICS